MTKDIVEIWRDIPGYEELYQASNHGRVKRLIGYQCRTERILKLLTRPDNHLEVGLTQNNVKKTHLVHRLILTTFVGICPPKMECRHLNGNPQDNMLTNIQWGTRSENVQDAIRHGTRYTGDHKGIKHHMVRLTEQQVLEIRILLQEGKSGVVVAEMFDMTPAAISHIRLRKTWSHI